MTDLFFFKGEDFVTLSPSSLVREAKAFVFVDARTKGEQTHSDGRRERERFMIPEERELDLKGRTTPHNLLPQTKSDRERDGHCSRVWNCFYSTNTNHHHHPTSNSRPVVFSVTESETINLSSS